jgi:hypothetical protein
MELRCAWWNTSLAPTKAQGRATAAMQAVALGVLGDLLEKRSVDLLGLGELSKTHIAWLTVECDKRGYGLVDGVQMLNRSLNDTCLIYRRAHFDFNHTLNIRMVVEGNARKIAQRVELKLKPENSIVTVFLSHWPSVQTLNKGNFKRDDYGIDLRKEVDSIFNVDPKAQIILMGDYNDEPFDVPMAQKLRASRDRHQVLQSKTVLYNPFWNRIGSDRNYLRDPDDVGFCGTHFYSADKVDRWRTFDQIIVSKSLLDRKRWHLDESSVQIIDIPSYTALVMNGKEKFDHFPVGITLRRT